MVSGKGDVVIADAGVYIPKLLSTRKLKTYGVEQG
jgi:hypothetical protein